MSVRIEIERPAGLTETGIDAITLNHRELTILGWYDMFAKWEVTVELDDDQARELHEELA